MCELAALQSPSLNEAHDRGALSCQHSIGVPHADSGGGSHCGAVESRIGQSRLELRRARSSGQLRELMKILPCLPLSRWSATRRPIEYLIPDDLLDGWSHLAGVGRQHSEKR